MSYYKADLEDIAFNLIDVLNIQQFEKYGLDEASIKEILREYNKFVETEIFPTRLSSDEKGVTLDKDGVKVPPELKPLNKSFYEMGWFAIGQPEEFEGTPTPSALASSCLSLSTAANTAWSMYPGLSKGAMNVIKHVGSEAQQKKYIPAMMEGRFGGTMNLTEASAGSDVGALKSKAKPIDESKGLYSIQGTKVFISSGDNDLYENIVHLVLARVEGDEAGTKGLSLFIVPKYRVDENSQSGEFNDVTCSKVEHKMGIHASATCVLNFGDQGNCQGELIGKRGEGIQNMFIMMNEARLDCGIQGEAQAHLAYEISKKYAHERVQFGKEIIHHPDIKRMLLKMRAMSRGLRSLILYTSNLFDKVSTDQKYQNYIELLTPICKSFCSEQGFNISVDAVQVHGGYGYCHEYGIEQFVRDTKIATIYEGTNGIQAIDFVMRKILKDEGKTVGLLMEEVFKTSNSLDESFSDEKALFSKILGRAQQVMGLIGKKAKEKDFDYILANAKDFLDMSAYVIICWRLMESAKVAHQKLAQGDQQGFYQSKIDDFKIFAQHYLVHADALAKTILSANITQFQI